MSIRRGRLLVVGLVIGTLFGFRAWASNEESEARMKRDITFLASDECEGRGPGTKGIDKAAEYIAAEFQKAGLKPGGPKDSYYQPFSVFGAAKLESKPVLRLRGPLGQEIDLRSGVDFQVLGSAGSGKVKAAVIFAGFGISAAKVPYDDFKDIDAAGKVVVVLRHTPRWGNDDMPFDGPRRQEHALLSTKQGLAEAKRAAALVLVNDAGEAAAGDKLMNFADTRGSAGAIPYLHVRRSVIEPMIQSSMGTTLKDLEQAIHRDLKPRSGVLKGWTATVETDISRPKLAVKNVIGVLEGAGPLAKETVVIGAHYDHLGYGGAGSRSKSGKKEIHHGADDNGSGTTTIMELARRFGAMDKREGRRLVFIAFSAEEMGLLGSRYYCNKEPLFPLADTVAMVNLDMVGRMRPDKKTEKNLLIAEGLGTAKGFQALVEKLNKAAGDDGFHLVKNASGYGPSDHDSFTRKKIPVIFYWTGMHEQYHKPTDTSDLINVPGMRRVADFAEKTIDHLATVKERPEYVNVPPPSFGPGKARLGIMPNYGADVTGVLVEGVAPGGPADKAGIKEGDLIVELGGQKVTSMSTYQVIMSRHRLGQEIDAVVIRKGQQVKLKVTPK